MRGSASTYVFNVVRILIGSIVGPQNLILGMPLGAPNILNLWEKNRHALIKAHSLSVDLRALIWFAHAPIIVSLRDPRDAVVSIMQRFNATFSHALKQIEHDCRTICDYMPEANLCLYYEKGYHRDPLMPKILASKIGVVINDTVSASIHKQYDTESMRKFAAAIETLPQKRLKRADTDVFDQITHIHSGHIGDGRTGKWRETLNPSQQVRLQATLRPFMATLGYEE
jgi:hypothetical protein